MAEKQAFLEKVRLRNFLSLHDVELPLKPLTVLVGPNASGKSNILSALDLLRRMMVYEKLPPVEYVRSRLWAGEANHITFNAQISVDNSQSLYKLTLDAQGDTPIVSEELLVDSIKVISVESGNGTVQDEDGKNATPYKSSNLALKSAGNYGNKPTTSIITEFIKGWELYDFKPDLIRLYLDRSPFRRKRSPKAKSLDSPKLDDEGSELSALLSHWYENSQDRFLSVSDSLAASTNLRITQRTVDGDNQLCLSEGYDKPIPLERASDGTLRLVAYYVLLNEFELPPLIAIEEPERNLHPGALADITTVLERISENSQVIITTHSSQLLDAFNPSSLADSLGVLLIRNDPGHGTRVMNLEDICGDREALDGWITDFGIGSAIFESELLQDLMEDTSCLP